MTPLRAFIAIELPLPIRQAIHHETQPLRAALGPDLVRWVPIENLHLTLKFLGDVSHANLKFISQMLTAEAANCPPFSIQIGGLGSFPNSRRVRVIWIGLHAPAALISLQHGIETAARRLGYEAEERPFSPHLTIGRVRPQTSPEDQRKIQAALSQIQIGMLGSANVTSVHLFKSDLKPSGAEYTRLFSAALKFNEVTP